MRPVAFDRFAEQLCHALELDDVEVSRSTRLLEDLGLDSIDLLRVVILVEDPIGAEVTGYEDFELPQTVGDVYEQYVARCAEAPI